MIKFPVEKTDNSALRTQRRTGATNDEIGTLFGRVSYSAVSKIYQRIVEKLQTHRELRKEIDKIVFTMSNVKG